MLGSSADAAASGARNWAATNAASPRYIGPHIANAQPEGLTSVLLRLSEYADDDDDPSLPTSGISSLPLLCDLLASAGVEVPLSHPVVLGTVDPSGNRHGEDARGEGGDVE